MPRDSTPPLVIPRAVGANATASEESVVLKAALSRNHFPQNLLHNLRRHRCRNAAEILHRVVLHHIRSHDLSLDGVQMRNGLPYRYPSRLAMRNSRRKRRVEYVHIEGDVNRPRSL